MKKIFSFVIVAFAAIALNAADVVFDFTNPAGLNPAVTPSTEKSTGVSLSEQTFTVGDVSIAFAKASGTGVKLFTKSDGTTYELRVYTPNSFTVTSTGDKISKIHFAFSQAGALAPETGTIDANGDWTGEAASITFSIPEKGKASWIEKITVYTGEAPVVKIDTLNVADMNALINAAGGQLSKQACVIGRVGGIDKSGAAQYGNINVWLADIRTANATDTIEAYRMKSFNNADYKDEEDIQFGIGDTIVFYAGEWKYYAEKDVNEGVSGYLVEVIGEGNPEPIVYDEITVAQALEIAQGLSPETGKTVSTTKKYNVQGFVVSISAKSGLDKIYLADDVEARGEFQAYKCEIPDGVTVNEGDFVSVIGYISAYHGTGSDGDYYNYEVAYGKLTVIDPTALPTVIAEKVSCKKMMINGQMYIKNGKKLYNVLGQAL